MATGRFDELLRWLPRAEAMLVVDYGAAPVFVPMGSDCLSAGFLRDAGHRIEAFPFDWCLSLGAFLPMFQKRFADFTQLTAHTHASGRRANRYNVVFFHDDIRQPETRDKFARRVRRLKGALRLPAESGQTSSGAAEVALRLPAASGQTSAGGAELALRMPAASGETSAVAAEVALRLPAASAETSAVAAEVAAAEEAGGVVNIIRISHKHVHHCELDKVFVDEIADMRGLDRFLSNLTPAPCYRIWLLLCCTRCFSAKTAIPSPSPTLRVLNMFACDKPLPMDADNHGVNVVLLRELAHLLHTRILARDAS
jgi:hypothetical protein